MTEKIKALEWKKNPVYVLGIITILLLLLNLLFFSLKIEGIFQIAGILFFLLIGGLTYLFSRYQCPNCKRVFNLKKISDEIVKKWEEPKQYKEKTIYYYSDGHTQKDINYGSTKNFTAKYERHKTGFNCKKCLETHYKTKNIFLNKDSWNRVTAPKKITTSTKPPKINTEFDMDAFEPTYYKTKSGKRKTIPKSVKIQLWEKYFGRKRAEGKCFVCPRKIHISQFEAGHSIPVSKNGSDKVSNLRPLCMLCNRSMGNQNLSDYKKRYSQKS